MVFSIADSAPLESGIFNSSLCNHDFIPINTNNVNIANCIHKFTSLVIEA